ncbi:MAG TPA: hypothetical protein VHU81_05370, partial [Thermoanaerobaculia bacterium]|nr:hypothetical protein [Thermoanaerobaculia bacterium]
MKRSLPLLLLALSLCAALPARAASSRWTQLGPAGHGQGEILSLASDPSRPDRVFAGLFGGGIARSGDGGRSWRSFGEGLRIPVINWIVVHPALGRLVFASDGVFLYRSLNDGRTWEPSSLRGVRALAADPRDPNVAWAAAFGGLYRTRDRGTTWERVQANLPRGYGATSVTISPADPRRMYVMVTAPSGFGLWTTADGGRTWVRRNRARAVLGIVLQADLHDARTVYLLNFREIQRSRDTGQTFELFFNTGAAGSPLDLQPRFLALDPLDPAVAYVSFAFSGIGDGLYRTTDGGRTWRLLSAGLPESFVLTALAVSSEGTVLLGLETFGSLAVYRSADRG